jgi:hypothetical protein
VRGAAAQRHDEGGAGRKSAAPADPKTLHSPLHLRSYLGCSVVRFGA